MSGLIVEFSKSGIIGQASNHFTIDRVDGVACFRQSTGHSFEQSVKLPTQRTTGVTNSAATIATAGVFLSYGGFYIVIGRNADDTTARFCDRFAVASGQSLQDLQQNTLRGSPASRSNSFDGSQNLQVTMGSAGNYYIVVTAIDAYTT